MTAFSEVLRGALRAADLDDTQYQFDDHSPISMAFTDVGDITFVPESDGVWVWHELAGITLWRLADNAVDVLGMLAAPVAFLSAGCTNLRLENESLWVGGLLSDGARQESLQLADGLNEFHGMIGRLRGIL